MLNYEVHNTLAKIIFDNMSNVKKNESNFIIALLPSCCILYYLCKSEKSGILDTAFQKWAFPQFRDLCDV